MRHKRKTRRLSRDTAHKKAMLRNMVTSLFLHDKLETTVAKAKELRPVAERMIGLAKRGDLHARRQAESYIRSHKVCSKLFADGKDRYQDRQGGYVRITPTRIRKGDAAPMAVVEIVSPAKEA
jgi:large subunit ribosomal protein L17